MRLKELRLKHNLTQIETAQIAQCSQSNYSKYELEKLSPDVNTLSKLANYYNVSLDYLCDRQWDNKAYIEVWKLSEEQKANLYLIEKLSPKNNLRANGYLLGLFQEQQTSEC